MLHHVREGIDDGLHGGIGPAFIGLPGSCGVVSFRQKHLKGCAQDGMSRSDDRGGFVIRMRVMALMARTRR
jgi:hypothetical protein